MKPLKLTITAFGPYKNTEVIDFQQLGEHRLFAISGKTGAGKTTIFDAICYALYGSGSGEDRQDTAMLRSGFAEDDVYTAVELVFEMHGKTYQILRQPGHIKAKNKSVTGKKVELAHVKEGQLDFSIVEKQQTNEVDKKLQEIVGLTKDQFSQIVMLPQGEFRKLLTSDSTNKEAILRKIFKTDRFGDITKKLDAKRKEAEKDLERAKQLKEHLLGQIAGALPQRSSALFTCIANNTENMHQLMTALEEEQTFYRESIQVEQQRYNEAYNHHQKEQEHYSMAKALNEQFEEHASRQERLKTLEQQQDVYDAKVQEIKYAEQAERLVMFEQQCKDLRTEQNRKEQTYQQATINMQTIEAQYKVAQESFDEEEAREPERQQVLQQELKLQALLPTFEAFEGNRQQLQIDEQGVGTAKRAVADNLTILQQQQNQLQYVTEKIEQYEEQVAPFADYLQQLPKLREQVALLAQVEKYERAVASAEQAVYVADHQYQDNKQTLQQLEQQWIASQARILAAQLKEGDPCPVCGSTTHQITHNEQLETIEEAQLELLRAKSKTDERTYFEKEATLKSAKILLQEAIEQIDANHISQGQQTELNAALQHVEKQVALLKVVNDQLAVSRNEQKSQRERTEQLQEKQTKLEHYLAEQQKALTKQQVIVEEQQKHIPENLETLQALKQAIADIGVQKNALQTAWQASQQNLQSAKEAASNAVMAEELAKKAYEEIQVSLNEKREQFSISMKEAGFESYQAYDAAKRSMMEMETLRKACSDYVLQLHTLQIQIAEGTKQLNGKEKKNLALLEDSLERLRETYEEAFNTLQRTKGFAQACGDFKVKVKETAEEIQLLEKEAGRVKELHALLNGQNVKKLSFERYIQINYLDKITAAANIRLYHLSNGQFELRRSDRLEKHAKQSGLGLDVYDAYTDQIRDVKTLSGGEKFNASLSLALGMADVIQSFQGNIRIDTMFIDEGFGSLDEEALNKAIDTLIDLQESGRMIGVISHVAELKASMPAVLHVEKTLSGHSKTRFEVK
ncbi:AAA family ATPase [Lysinibacillus sphaericus]|uniref:Nuclease SbcCD subunit C n=1 Tax=Lysinibacillus sphaericus OT4b.31 TaxID=1285586 RepID=R7ZK70_LYSSH|nr:SMC family ATPase [Lysinibacillus sphaericus]EON74466.1 nuclease sbcCD subunit C [Lysinibacillus sphaericus OT4b.31]